VSLKPAPLAEYVELQGVSGYVWNLRSVRGRGSDHVTESFV